MDTTPSPLHVNICRSLGTYLLDDFVDFLHLSKAGLWSGWEILVSLLVVDLGDLDVFGFKLNFVDLK